MNETEKFPANTLFFAPVPFVETPADRVIEIRVFPPGVFAQWAQTQSPARRAAMLDQNFSGAPGKVVLFQGDGGMISEIALGVGAPLTLYDFAVASDFIRKNLSPELMGAATFRFCASESPADPTCMALGWALGCYSYNVYKGGSVAVPRLIWPDGADRKAVESLYSGISLTRNLVNAPANDLGPAELEAVAGHLARTQGASVSVVSGESLSRDFPLIHAVGRGSPRAPRLIDITWGAVDHPRLTIIGKGVCFDTGGLNLKPGSAMSLMKKDMGGAAHALGLARAIMGMGLPVRLRVLVPAVENSVSGEAFRPRDVIRSRKGLSVEILDTDAEGRLILADALALACEEKPDLLLDFATLTGAARVALGFDIPALFGNRAESVARLKNVAAAQGDPLWDLPLWRPYLKEMDSDIADLANIGTGPAGCIQAALFLEKFVTPETDWIHIDQYAWESSGRPGRPKGGCDMGLRAVLAYLTERFGV
ncbi:MAG: leucyl aminopeptidase family protein [Rhodospirillales bacterium]|nr:leucyl aminopeptidase family protein [Rhodospirillales bacterium]